jgi:protein involved in polysaccharide export with SLBB domain
MKLKIYATILFSLTLFPCCKPLEKAEDESADYQQEQPQEEETQFTMVPGVVYHLSVKNMPVADSMDFTGEYVIDNKGDMYFPHTGAIAAEGKKNSEVEAEIRIRLIKADLYTNPTFKLIFIN